MIRRVVKFIFQEIYVLWIIIATGHCGVAAVQHERKPVLGDAAATKVGSRNPRVKPEPQQAVPDVPPVWEQPESPSMEDQSSDSDVSDALTLARERLLISHALDSMAKLIGEVSCNYYLRCSSSFLRVFE